MRDRFALICPSRGRPGNLERLARSISETSSRSDLIVVLDDDDEARYPRLEGVRYVVGPRVGFVGSANLGLEAAREYRYLGCIGDDFIFRTDGWDQVFIEHMKQSGPAICYGNDLFQGENLPTQWFVSSEIVNALGWIALPELVHLCSDAVWMDIGKAIDRLKYFDDVVIEHMHYVCGKAELDEVYNHPSWKTDEDAYVHFLKHGLGDVADRLRALL